MYCFYPDIKFKQYNKTTKLHIYKGIDIHHNMLIIMMCNILQSNGFWAVLVPAKTDDFEPTKGSFFVLNR